MISNQKEFQESIFVTFTDNSCLEYLTNLKFYERAQNPVEFQAALIWQSHNDIKAISFMYGCYQSQTIAHSVLKQTIKEMGGEIISMDKNGLKKLEQDYNYPENRSTDVSFLERIYQI